MSVTQKPFVIKFSEKKTDKPGILTPIEDYEVGMEIKRVFFISQFHNSDKTLSRGHHGHYNSKQVIICVSGSCTIKVSNEEGHEAVYALKSANIGVVLPPGNLIIMYDFSEDAILLVLCDKNYKDDVVFSN
jgi:hypothetical protein